MGALKLAIVICVVYLANNINADIIVETELGKVEGVEVKSIIKDEKYFSFMGIPYGKAPVGSLRYRAPEPHEGWTGVLKAKKEKPHCTQYNLPIKVIKESGLCGKDDCLHLSIHTPKLPKENENPKLPVVVFLYNEHFRVSHNGSKDFGPDFFMKEDVIVTTINYRLGAAGFLSFEDEVLPGNNGIRDVILALKWIQKHIPNFGGDPQRVTLLGVDGGAVLADILLLSPKAKGLFSKVILQSGSSWQSLYFPESPKSRAKQLAAALDRLAVTSKGLIKELSSVETGSIVEAELQSVDADEGRASQRSKVPFGPTIEPDHPDAIISKLPEDGPLNIDIPVMIGYNSRGNLELLDRFLRSPQYLTFADRDFLLVLPTRDSFRFKLNSNIYFKAIQELKDFYFDEGYIKISKPGEYMTFSTDMMMFYPIDYTVRKYVNESKSDVYYYTFDYSGELNMRKNDLIKLARTIEGAWGSTMGDELCYMFVCKPIRNTYLKILEEEDSEEFQVLKNMIKMWTNFIKHGNPTPPGNDFTWTPATKENKDCLIISDELQMKQNLHGDRIEFWDNWLAKYKALAVKGVVDDVKDEL